eukprot:EG_transcript_26964
MPPCEVEVDLSEVIRRSVDDTEVENVPNYSDLTGRLMAQLRPPLPPLPRRASVLPAPNTGGFIGSGIHRGQWMPPKSPLASPLGIAESNGFLDPDSDIPGWWLCAGHSGCFLIPTFVLLGLAVGLFVPNGQPCVWWYPVVFTVFSTLGPFTTWAASGLHTHHQLLGLRHPEHMKGADLCPMAPANPDSTDSNGALSPKSITVPRNRNDPLDFLRRDLAEWASSGDGWIV